MGNAAPSNAAPSVHVALRLPPKLHKALVQEVDRSGRTLSEVVRAALAQALLPGEGAT